MILADKIIRLRKKNGWSQEELAEKMNVSRQAVSKWEGAQTIPDLGKVLQLSNLFGVTTDYLLKDEIEDEEFTDDNSDTDVKKVSMEEANEYIAHKRWASVITAIATFLCVISPIALIALGAVSELTSYNMSENMAGSIGLVTLLIIVAIAVAMFVYTGFKDAPYEYLDKTAPFELEYGVRGMVKEKQKSYRNKYVLGNVMATCVCVISPVPLLVGAFTENEFLTAVLLCGTIAIAGVGASMFVFNGIRWGSMEKLLKEGEYSDEEKKKSKVRETVGTVYWLSLTAIYLTWSFISNDWEITWIVYAVGGVLFAAVMAICNLFIKKNDEDM